MKPRTNFGEDNFKHWKDTFKFQSYDDDNAEYKDVKIKMEDVMDRIAHYRKKYDEDDAFVRAVVDTHENVVRILFTKDLAHLTESVRLVGLINVLRLIREDRGEMEIWSVSRPTNGNWFLVKCDFNKKELSNMDLNKKEPEDREKKVNVRPEEGLKKKEQEAINVLKINEKKGLEILPVRIKEKVKEKISKGWTTEVPPQELGRYFTKSFINTAFADKIEIYKLKPTKEFFHSLKTQKENIDLSRGFCRTLYFCKRDLNLSNLSKDTVENYLEDCNTRFDGKLGVSHI
jgi:hypothetical protein